MSITVYEAARIAVAHGISVVPVDMKTKEPFWSRLPKDENGDRTWATFQKQIADEETLRAWFSDGKAGLAIVCGAVSGGLLVLDHDILRFYDAWLQNVGELVDGLPIQRSKNNGRHVLLRCPNPGKNQKLAWAPNEEEETGREISIETRGEGGYIVVYPSDGYEFLIGSLTSIPTVSQARADALLAAAASLDEAPYTRQQLASMEQARQKQSQHRAQLNGEGSVIDAYNASTTIEETLEKYGYKRTSKEGRWIRPGGEKTSVVIQDGKSYHHNSNDVWGDGYWHDPFDFYCYYEHNNDPKAAARALLPPRPEPTIDEHGYALCPNCGRQLERDKSGKGYHCPKEGPSLCYWWKGEGYTQPAGAFPYGLRHGTGNAAGVTPQPSRLVHANDLALLPKAEELIPGMLFMNKLHEIFGPPGSGKSFVNADIALSVAEFAPVVYIAAEDVEDYPARIQAWCEHHDLTPKQLFFWPEPVNLMNPDSVASFLAAVLQIQPALIVIDTLQNCMVGADENSTKDMGIAIEALNYIRRQTQAAILVTHHTGWSDTHERGSSALRGACRVVLKLSQNDDGLMTLTCEKINGAKAFEPRYFRLLPKGESAALIPSSKITRREDALTEKHFALLEALALPIFLGGASHSQLVDHTEMPKATVNRGLSKLLDRGYVEGSDGRYRTYTLTSTGQHELQSYLFQTADASSARVPREFQGQAELGLNWAVTPPVKAEGSSTIVPDDSPHSDAVVSSVPSEFHPSSTPPELFRSVHTPYRGEQRNSEQTELAEETEEPSPDPMQDRDKRLAFHVEALLEIGDFEKAKAKANQINDRALWDASMDMIDEAKARLQKVVPS